MKIAVYCITKNEEQFIERWAESAKDADYRVVLDTGSTDKTVELAQAAGCIVSTTVVDPWRFDTARNQSLELVPEDADMCIALDADEVLVEGWREHLEKVGASTTRPRYEYTWSWNEDGTPGLTYWGDKIHSRKGYYWKHPVHEVITPLPYGIEEVQEFVGLNIHHFPDSAKSRGQYLPLLELAVAEDPEDDRNSHYLGREYFYRGMNDKAALELKRHLSLPKALWAAERAKSMRMLAKCIPHDEETWLLRAAAEEPGIREPWLDLANLYYRRADWTSCLAAAERCLSIVERPITYINEAESWGHAPYDYAAIAAFRLGLGRKALEWGTQACLMDPHDPRLQANMEWYRSVNS
jgi:glycosyltransferase involved in cell wall biosynthesis